MSKTVKKKLEHFIKDESGKISKDKVLKVGLGTLAILGSLQAPAVAAHTNTATHSNVDIDTTPSQACPTTAHASHASHASHDSY